MKQQNDDPPPTSSKYNKEILFVGQTSQRKKKTKGAKAIKIYKSKQNFYE